MKDFPIKVFNSKGWNTYDIQLNKQFPCERDSLALDLCIPVVKICILDETRWLSLEPIPTPKGYKLVVIKERSKYCINNAIVKFVKE